VAQPFYKAVYAALAAQSGLRSWWTADNNAEERAGGKAEFGFDRRSMVFRMTIEKLEPRQARGLALPRRSSRVGGQQADLEHFQRRRGDDAPVHPRRLEVDH
jgi:hypothetical protein